MSLSYEDNGPAIEAANTALPVEIHELPLLEAYGSIDGRDQFRETCRKLFADPGANILRRANGHVVIFRNEHLRAFSILSSAGNTPPDVLANGSYEALRDPKQAPPGTGGAIVRALAWQVFFMNNPLHGSARGILVKQLSPRQVSLMEPLAARVINELLASVVDAGQIDFQHQFADELTSRFWAVLLGMSDGEQQELLGLVRQMSGFLCADPSQQELEAFDRAAGGYTDMIVSVGQRAAKLGGYAIVDAMAAELATLDFADDAAMAGVLASNVGEYLAGNLIDAFHTAALATSNVLYAILCHPDILERLREDPGRVPAATAEGFRLESPALHMSRYAVEDIIFEGVRIPKGTRIEMLWGAGNHDPDVFPEPERFSLDRSLRGGTTFGGGGRICPGRILATMLVQKTIQTLIDQRLEFDFNPDDCPWDQRSVMAQMTAMPLSIKRAQAQQ